MVAKRNIYISESSEFLYFETVYFGIDRLFPLLVCRQNGSI
jgi:hypothetical protein